MGKILDQKMRELKKSHSRKKIWRRGLSVLMGITVFITTYALILPAITMEKTYCGKEEHTHSVENGCYKEDKKLICTQQEAEQHTHGDKCYKENKKLKCELPETAGGGGHTHLDACRDGNGKLVCVKEEAKAHTHGDDCYTVEKTLTCGKDDNPNGHVHNDSCYHKTLTTTCTKEEHRHGKGCYSNPQADVETKAKWESSMNGVKLTGVWADDVLAVADSQLGYKESKNNYIVTESGDTKGYTRYGAWYGDAHEDWCAMFVSFCLNYANVDRELMPIEANCQNWINKLTAMNNYHPTGNADDKNAQGYIAPEKYKPATGDLIFFDWNGDGKANHIGFVYEYVKDENGRETKIKTIEGNSSDTVKYNTYDLTDKTIIGYGTLPENPNPNSGETTIKTDEEPAQKTGETLATEQETEKENEEETLEETNLIATSFKAASLEEKTSVAMTSRAVPTNTYFRALASNLNLRAGANSTMGCMFPGKTQAEVVAAYKKYLGVPYRWGGATPDGWDCSGYVTYVAKTELGVDMGRNTMNIASYGNKRKCKVFVGRTNADFKREIDNGTIRAGDVVVYFMTEKIYDGVEEVAATTSTHTSVVSGNGYNVFHAPGTGKLTQESTFTMQGGEKRYNTFVVYRGVETVNLEVVKRVTDDYYDNEKFDFTVTIKNGSNNFIPKTYKVINTTTLATVSRTVKVDGNGQLTVKLGKDEKLVVENIPRGYTATVKEAKDSNYTTTYKIDGGNAQSGLTATTTLNATKKVAFTNVRKNFNLTVGKYVYDTEGKPDTSGDKFQFIIDIFDEQGRRELPGDYAVYKIDGTLINRDVDETLNGQLKVLLGNDEKIVVKGIPIGYVTNVREIVNNNYTTTYNVDGGNETAGDTVEIPMNKNQNRRVFFRNRRRPTKLRVKKFIEGVPYTTDKFDFKIDIKNGNNVFKPTKYTVYDASNKPITGRANVVGNTLNVTLGHQDYVVVENIPKGYTATVTETLNNNYTTKYQIHGAGVINGNTANVTMDVDERQVDFTNTKKTIALYVQKNVVNDPTGKEFTFTVDITRGNERFVPQSYAVMNAAGTVIQNHPITKHPNGQLELKLRNGIYLKVDAIPVDYYTATVKEVDRDTKYTTQYKIDDNGTNHTGYQAGAELKAAQKVIFTNTRKPVTLTVKKTVPVNAGGGTFKFTVDIANGSTRFIPADETYKVYDRYNSVVDRKITKEANGRLTVSLYAGDRLVITNIPTDYYTATVTETADNNYTTKYKKDNGAEQTGQTAGSIYLNTDREVEFINRPSRVPLHVEKVLADERRQVYDPFYVSDEEFEFTVKIMNGNSQFSPANGTYKIYDFNGAEVNRTISKSADGQLTFKLKHYDKLIVTGVPIGSKAIVTEIANDNYSTEYNVSDGEIGSGYGQEENVADVTMDSYKVVKFINSKAIRYLTVKKTVIGKKLRWYDTREPEKFRFEINITSGGEAFTPEPEDCQLFNSAGQMLGNADIRNVELDHGEYLRIKVPYKSTAIVSETFIGGDGDAYTTKYKINSGAETTGRIAENIYMNTNKDVEFINKVTDYKLTVKKTVFGNPNASGVDAMSPSSDKFEFNIDITKGSQRFVPANGTYKVYDINGNQITRTVNKNTTTGSLTVELGHGEYIVVEGIPNDGFKATVTETANNKYKTKYKIYTDGTTEKTETRGYTATTNIDTNKQVDFINSSEKVILELSKNVYGEYNGDPNQQKLFKFIVDITNDDGSRFIPYDGSFKVYNRLETLQYRAFKDANGRIHVELGENEYFVLNDLPLGCKATITEEQEPNYISSYSFEDISRIGNVASVDMNDDKQVRFTNYEKVDVTVKKNVVGDPSGKEQFEFNIDITNGDERFVPEDGNWHVYDREGKNINRTVTKSWNGRLTVWLGNGEYIVIKEIPYGYKAKATETAKKNYRATYKTSDTQGIENGTVAEVTLNGSKSIEFTNKKDTIDLVVKKNVDGDPSGKEQFDFTIDIARGTERFIPANGTYEVYDISGNKIGRTVTKGTSGWLRVKLGNGERIKVTGIPIDYYTATVKETANNGYTTTYKLDAGVKTGNTASTYMDASKWIEFNNTRKTVDLVVKKNIIGELGKNDQFEFTIDIARGTERFIPANGSYKVYNINGNVINRTVTKATNGQLKVKLGNGERIEITGIPINYYTATVKETTNNNYTTTYKVDPGIGGQGTTAGNIYMDTSKWIDFDNTRKTVDLVVKKNIIGPRTGDQFEFTIDIARGTERFIPANGSYKVYNINGNVINRTVTKATNGQLKVKLGNGERIEITGIPINYYTATVKETFNIYYTTYYKVEPGSEGEGNVADNIYMNESKWVEYDNFRDGYELDVLKTVVGDPSGKDMFKFTVDIEDDNKNRYIPDDGTYKVFDKDGKEIKNRTVLKDKTSGRLTVELGDGERLHVINVPSGFTATITEAPDNRYNTEVQVITISGSRLVKDNTVAVFIIDKSEVEYINTRKTIDLTVKKTVKGDPSGAEKFDFTVDITNGIERFIPADGTYKVFDSTGVVTNREVKKEANGQLKVQLGDGEKMVVTGIPIDYYTATVTETVNDKYSTVFKVDTELEKQGDKAEPYLDANKTVEFINTRKLVKLMVKKYVEGDKTGKAEFNFDIDITDGNTRFVPADDSYKVYDKNATVIAKTVTRDLNGKLSVTLGNEEYILIEDIPMGYSATIKEVEHPNYTVKYKYTPDGPTKPEVEQEGDTAIVNMMWDQNVFFYNKSLGGLEVVKHVVGDPTGEDLFDFTVDIVNGNTKFVPADGTYQIYDKDDQPIARTVTKEANGRLTFKLGNGDKLRVIGLPATGYTAKVVEAENTEYTTTYTVNGTTTDGLAADVKIEGEEKVEFTNTRKLIEFTVKKIVQGDVNGEFNFEVTFKDKNGNPFNLPAEAGYTVEPHPTNPEQHIVKFNLKHNESVTMKNIPVGINVTVVETNSDRYIVKVTDDTDGGTLSNSHRVEMIITKTQGITFVNNKDVSLPRTGGAGTLPYTLGGIAVMATALVFVFSMRRKQKGGVI